MVANIQAEVLVPHAAEVRARVGKGGLLILSGILDVQRERVLAAYEGLELLEVPVLGEWIALVFRA